MSQELKIATKQVTSVSTQRKVWSKPQLNVLDTQYTAHSRGCHGRGRHCSS